MLTERFPLGERSIRALAMAMLELLQNIPHHANPLGEDLDPWGLLAVREYRDHIHLVAMDKGVGLTKSLALDSASASVSQVYQLLQRLRATEYLYHLGPPFQFLDQPFQLVGGVKVGPDTFGMVQKLREGLLSNHLATSFGYFPAHFSSA